MRRIGLTSTSLVVALTALAACARGGAVETAPPPSAQTERDIRTLLVRSADAWNDGDLDGFLLPYLHSDEVSYVGSRGPVRGYERLRQNYASSYWRNGDPDRKLGFRDIEVTPLGASYALAVGWYVLSNRGDGRETDRGIFSLVLRRTPDGWRILHDHSFGRPARALRRERGSPALEAGCADRVQTRKRRRRIARRSNARLVRLWPILPGPTDHDARRDRRGCDQPHSQCPEASTPLRQARLDGARNAQKLAAHCYHSHLCPVFGGAVRLWHPNNEQRHDL